jgi:hypothetical protein
MAYAHASIEDPRNGNKFHRGDKVPDDLPGLDELVEAGSVSDEKYDPDSEPKLAPEEVVIDGVTYKKASDTVEDSDGAQR